MSFFAFLFSIVFYISIFYIFSLSPSTLLGNTKFWFVISNTLILIIAADYGAFSSSQQDDHLYEEYALHSHAAARRSTAVISPPPFVKMSNIPKEEESLEEKKIEDDIKDIKMNEIPERTLEVVKIEPAETQDNFRAKSQPENPIMKVADHNESPDDQVIFKKKIEPKPIRRSKSHKVKHVTVNDMNNSTTTLRRSNTEKHDHEAVLQSQEFPEEEEEEKENEFSTMSDEELNRRVEEFIQRFNMQIRLQESSG